MRENKTERKHLIAKRRKQFAALVLGVVVAMLPTVEVMAETVTMTDYDRPELEDNIKIYNDDKLEWKHCKEDGTLSSGYLAVLYYKNDEDRRNHNFSNFDNTKDYADEHTNGERHKDAYTYSLTINKNLGIDDFDHWKADVEYKVFDVNQNEFVARTNGDWSEASQWGPGNVTRHCVVNLVAVKEYTVTIEPEYPNGAHVEGPKPRTEDHKLSEAILNEASQDILQRFQDERYDLVGFYTQKEGKGDKITKDYVFNESTTVYAYWARKYNVTFHSNYPNGSGEETIRKQTVNKKVDFPSADDFEKKPEGYKLDGFSRTKSGEVLDPETEFDEDVDLYARWSKKKKDEFTIKFYPNYPGKGIGTPVEKETTDHKIDEYPKFKRDGYKLKGFYTEPEGGDRVTTKEFTKDTLLYAHWGKDDSDSSSGSDNENENNENNRPANYNPLALNAYYYENNVINPAAVFAREEQGPAAMFAFARALPQGWKLGFSFSLSINGKNEKTLKNGTIKMYVPAEYLKKNRQYAIMALDKNGQAKVIYDADAIEELLTASPNTEGYAYELIYKD